MEAPSYQQPPLDPQYAAVKAQAEQDKIAAIQTEIQHDSAGLLARYGTMQAFALSTAAAGAPQRSPFGRAGGYG